MTMHKLLVPLAATALVAGGLALSTPASALPIGPVAIDDRPRLAQQANWARGLERAGDRFLRTTKRNAPKREVSATGNVRNPSRPASDAGWGDVPGGPRRAGIR
jgi:hypothetical protein